MTSFKEDGAAKDYRHDPYWMGRCVDCHRRIHGAEFYVWGFFVPWSTIPRAITGPLHKMHLTRYGWDRIWCIQ